MLAPHPVFACGARLRYVGSLERTPIVSDVAEGKAQQLQALAMASDSFSLIFIERSCLAETHDRICGRPHEPVNEFRCPQGGRWMIPGRSAVLYTCLTKDGDLAEIRYHWSLLTPPPSKPVVVSELSVRTQRCVRIERNDFAELGIVEDQFEDRKYTRTQEIGAAAVFFGFDGLIVPSARSLADNLVLLSENHSPDLALEIVAKEEVVLGLP